MPIPTIGEFKGHKMINLNPNDRFPFQFGLTKAKLIMENIEAIKAFVNGQALPEPVQTAPAPAAVSYATDDDNNLM